jgi:hypothetical protein
VQINPDAIARNDPVFYKRMCELIAELFQFRIGERLIEKSHRFCIRAPLSALSQ